MLPVLPGPKSEDIEKVVPMRSGLYDSLEASQNFIPISPSVRSDSFANSFLCCWNSVAGGSGSDLQYKVDLRYLNAIHINGSVFN